MADTATGPDLNGKTALVTGGASGLGNAMAGLLARHGARILIGDINAGAAEAAAGNLPGSGHLAQTLDVRDEASCEAAVGRAATDFGRLDILINSAGIFRIAPAVDMDIADFEQSLAINVTGSFLMARHAGRVMIKAGSGRIINMASVSSTVVNPEYAAYSTSKAAVSQLTRILGMEWAKTGVTVNAIGPAVIPTPMSAAPLANADYTAAAIGKIPMGRFGAPEDLFGVVLMLVSPSSDFITGQVFYVDGGRTLS
jgi:NAD(P)-dependent dehydrogenase (short-subunit alcohol dehydrogenase family)